MARLRVHNFAMSLDGYGAGAVAPRSVALVRMLATRRTMRMGE